jgi:hypothetical protein
MNLTDAIYKIEYTLAGKESQAFINKEDDYDLNRLTIFLSPVIKLFDYFIEVEGREIVLEEIDVMLRYRVTFDFDSIDIVNETCSYNINVEFRSAYAFDIIEKNGLSKDVLNAQIESDIRDGRNIVLDDPTFKVFVDSLQ